MKRLLVLLLILLAEAGPTAACSSSCLAVCDCSGKGLSSVPQDLPTNITHLHLPNNFITTLNQSDFSRYSNLTTLQLNNNQIFTINRRVFYNLHSLTHLYLYNNQLTSLRPDMFVGLDNLQYLRLDNNNIRSIEAGAFNATPQLQTLRLHANQLTSLRPDMFVGLDSLQFISLHHNNIQSIEAGTFNATPQLQTLYLYNNQLTSLRPDMFVGLDSLQNLRLDNNNIHSIETGAFNATPQLIWLRLQYNNISTITAGTFVNLPRLQTLWLSHNRINIFPSDLLVSNLNFPEMSDLTLNDNQMETLPAMAYDTLASVSTVDINNNPWQCDCRMLPFKLRMTGTYSFENQTTCAGPANLTGKSLLWDVNPDDLICEETTTEIYSSPSGSSPVTRSTQQFHPESSPTTAPSTTNFHYKSSPTTAPSTTNFHSESSPTDTLSTTKFLSGVTEDSTASSPASFSLSAFLSGFLGGIVGSLLTSAVFLAIWCTKMRVKTSLAPVPDPSHVYTNPNGAAPGPTSGLHHTGQGASPSQAADSDVVESRPGTSGTVPPPRSFDKSYAVLRAPLPPIKTAGPQGDGRNVPEAAHGDAAADNSVPLSSHLIYQQTFPSRLPKGLAGL